MRMDTVWEESLGHRLKVERNLNFSTISNEEDEYGFSRKKTARDPMSHRIIEKRRRDRMNNCLADLSRLVPTNYLKKGRGRIEKTEIIEMAIKHLKHLQAHPCKDPATCEVAKTTEQDHKRQYRLGFHECLSETVRFMVEIEGLYAGDGICVRLVNHLQKHYDKVSGGMCYTQALGMISPEEKPFPMDVDINHKPHSNHIDGYPETAVSVSSGENNHSPERSSDAFPSADTLKQEHDVNSNSTTNNFHETVDFASPAGTAPVKVASQLREMLQNPGLPKEQQQQPPPPLLQQTVRNHVSVASATPTVNSVITTVQRSSPTHSSRGEEVYKFKNNIKHRFNADLRHLSTSPTDSHSDRISLPDEGHHYNDHQHETMDSVSSTNHNGQHAVNGHHRHFVESDISIKIPSTNNGAHQWETGSSCGSNPSTPPVPRSNGSTTSSGYSTNGDSSATKFKDQPHPGQHSPAVSPYSRTMDNLIAHSPSPPVEQQYIGVPIFALHPKGTFYIPLTIDAGFLAPYLMGLDELAPVLHPISICVNFSVSQALKVEKLNGKTFQLRTQSYFTDRVNERYVYNDRHNF